MLPTPERLAEFIMVGGLCVKCWVKPMRRDRWGIYCNECWFNSVDKSGDREWRELTDAWFRALGKK